VLTERIGRPDANGVLKMVINQIAGRGHSQTLWADADESTRSAIGAVIAKRMDSFGITADELPIYTS